jgi:hypothetical protein
VSTHAAHAAIMSSTVMPSRLNKTPPELVWQYLPLAQALSPPRNFAGTYNRRIPLSSLESAAGAFPMTQPSAVPLHLNLAPVGVSRAGHGLFWIGICFCCGVAVISAAMLIFPHIGGTHKGVYVPPSHEPMPWPVWVVMGGFAVVSIAVLVAGINMGIGRGTIDADERTLRIEQTGLFGSRCIEWAVDQIVAIRAEPTGFSVGGTKKRGAVTRSGVHGHSIYALYVDLNSGRTVHFFTGRDAQELCSIAAQLREVVCRANANQR